MNSSIACRYPRFDSGERRLSRTADLLWSRSGRPSFVFGRFSFEDFRLACLLIPAASTAAGQEPMPARRRVGRFYSQWITSELRVTRAQPRKGRFFETM